MVMAKARAMSDVDGGQERVALEGEDVGRGQQKLRPLGRMEGDARASRGMSRSTSLQWVRW